MFDMEILYIMYHYYIHVKRSMNFSNLIGSETKICYFGFAKVIISISKSSATFNKFI